MGAQSRHAQPQIHPTTLATCRLELPNRRVDLQVAYVRGTKLVSTSPVLTNAAPNKPTGVKVVPDLDPTSTASVQWQTRNASEPRVVFGTSPSALTLWADATTGTYTKADIIHANGPGVLNNALTQMTAVLQGWLDPGGRGCRQGGGG